MTRQVTRWFVLVMGVVAGTAGRAEANLILDPVNDFIPSYTAGPRNGDLDVTSVGVTFNGSRFVLTATLNGTLGTTRGRSTSGASTGAPGRPGSVPSLRESCSTPWWSSRPTPRGR